MWRVLERFFKKEQPALKVADLQQWFESRFSEEEGRLNSLVEDWRKKIRELIQLGHESLESLRSANLLNPNISIREKQFMDGNRKSYIQRTKIFLGEVNENLAYQPELFFTYYAASLEEFTKGTIKAYQVLKEFLANEAQEVAMHVKEIDKAVAGYRNDPAIRRFSRMQMIKKKFSLLDNRKKKKEELHTELSTIDSEIALLMGKNEGLQKQKEQTLSSEMNSILEQRKEKKADILQRKKELEDSFSAHFSVLARAFRKYEKIALQHRKLVEHYTADPLNAVMTDHTFLITEILESINKNLNSFELKNEDKLRDEISKLSKEYFSSFVSAMKNFRKEEEKINSDIASLEETMGVSGMDEESADIENRMAGLHARKEAIQKELHSLEINTFRQGIKKEIEDALAVKLEI